MQPTAAPKRSGRARARRYLPFAAILVVVGLVAAFLSGGGGGGSREEAGAVKDLPLTFQEAAAQGKHIAFGAGCDPQTGRVRIPSVYAAPCVEPWKGRDNGGATWQGVTKDRITVVVYVSDPKLDPLQAAFLRDAGANVDPDANRRGFEDYLRLFERHYEFYGRQYRIAAYVGTGAPDDEVKAKADAIAIADRYHPFAVVNGPTQSNSFADELAARKILCVGVCSLAFPQAFTAQREPYLWSIGPSPEQANRLAAEMVGTQLAGKKATFAGDRRLRTKKRVFGLVHYDNPDGRYKPGFDAYVDTLRTKYGVKAATDFSYFLDLSKAGELARVAIARLKEAGVTTVVFSGDPIMPSFLTKEATAQDYFPEWVATATVLADTAIFGRTYDQRQWTHAIALSLVPARGETSTQDGYLLHEWQYCTAPPSQNFQVLFPGPQILSTGIQLAGPRLTPRSFEAGLFRAPVLGGGPTRPAVSLGRHGIWPGLDLNGLDDAALAWWDPDAKGVDETGHEGTGLYQYTDRGRRHRLGQWPTRAIKLFDRATSVAIFDHLPATDRAPAYPSPCGGSR